MRTFLTAAALLTSLAAPAFAGDQDFKLVNKTGYQIDEVYVSSVNSKNWGNDIMGTGTLAANASVNITFTAPANVCRWDLMVKYSDASTAEWNNLNLCSISTVSLFWDAKGQVSRAVSE